MTSLQHDSNSLQNLCSQQRPQKEWRALSHHLWYHTSSTGQKQAPEPGEKWFLLSNSLTAANNIEVGDAGIASG